MSPPTSFKSYHVYALRNPLAPNSQVTHAIILTRDDYLFRHYYNVVSVLLLYPSPRDRETNVRVRIDGRAHGGKANITGRQYALIDSVFPVEKVNLIRSSESEITGPEQREIKEKLKAWFGL